MANKPQKPRTPRLVVKVPIIYSIKTGEYIIYGSSSQDFKDSRREIIDQFLDRYEDAFKTDFVNIVLPTFANQEDRNRLAAKNMDDIDKYENLIKCGLYNARGEFLLEPEHYFRDLDEDTQKELIDINLTFWRNLSRKEKKERLTKWGLFK